MKLHLGAGNDIKHEYINIDLYSKNTYKWDICNLPIKNNSIDEIISCSFLEHLTPLQLRKGLEEWYRVLKSGGRMYHIAPDIELNMKSFLRSSDIVKYSQNDRECLHNETPFPLIQAIFGIPDVPGMAHYNMLSKMEYYRLLEEFGFVNIHDVKHPFEYYEENRRGISPQFSVECFKL